MPCVDATSAQAEVFFFALGFEISPIQPMTLMATLSDLRSAL
jgi:hypothetical protein